MINPFEKYELRKRVGAELEYLSRLIRTSGLSYTDIARAARVERRTVSRAAGPDTVNVDSFLRIRIFLECFNDEVKAEQRIYGNRNDAAQVTLARWLRWQDINEERATTSEAKEKIIEIKNQKYTSK